MKRIDVQLSVWEDAEGHGPLDEDYSYGDHEGHWGKMPVKGYQSKTPGLAVTRDISRAGWTVTHMQSGLSIPWSLRLRVEAAKMAELMGDVADWTGTKEAVVAACGEDARARMIGLLDRAKKETP